MISPQRLIDEYETLRRQALDHNARTALRVSMARKALTAGGMVGFMQCAMAFLSPVGRESQEATATKRPSVSPPSAPPPELIRALAEMALTIVSRELAL